jgi:hypothetical protein
VGELDKTVDKWTKHKLPDGARTFIVGVFFFFFESIQGYITVPKCSLHGRRYRVRMYAVMRSNLRCRCEAEGRANRPRRGTSSRVPTYHPSRVAWGRGAGAGRVEVLTNALDESRNLATAARPFGEPRRTGSESVRDASRRWCRASS